MTTLHAALVTPLTGPLGLYGKTCATALTLWAKKAANLPADFTEVELDVQDTADHLNVALQTTLEKRPDVVFGPYGSGPMLTVARSCTRRDHSISRANRLLRKWSIAAQKPSRKSALFDKRSVCPRNGMVSFRSPECAFPA